MVLESGVVTGLIFEVGCGVTISETKTTPEAHKKLSSLSTEKVFSDEKWG